MGAIIAMDRALVRPATVAFDRASVRTVDQDGRLHVALSNISKATVSPYYGHEIPGYAQLGLSAGKIYKLLRCPEELKKAAKTFNNLPILSQHVAVSAAAPQQSMVIGSTGTDVKFSAPYLQNSAVIWVQSAIDDINAGRKKEWSCGYYYSPDMTPGNFNGLRYDGIMRNIVGNHVALVDQGRAGPDVMVGDAMPKGLRMKKSYRALMLNGAMAALISPRLAADKALDLAAVLGPVTAKTRGQDTETLGAAVLALAVPMLATDHALELADVTAAILAADAASDDDDDMASDDDETDEEKAARLKKEAAAKEKPAMDAAAIRTQVLAEAHAMREAERAVAPFIGEVRTAHDSAADIYKLALDHAKVDLTDVDPSAYKALVSMLPKATKAEPIALDRATVETSFNDRFGACNLIAS